MRGQDESLQPRLEREVDRHRPLMDPVSRAVRGCAKRDLRVSGEQDEVARLAARRRDVLHHVGEPAHRADDRGRPDVHAMRRVVQRHVPGHDRDPERVARRGDALDGPSELPGALRPLGVADVEAVGDRDRSRAHAHEIARRFPQFNLPDDTIGYYQPDYSLLAADRCVATLAGQARRHGARIHEHESVREIEPSGSSVVVRTEQATYKAERVILAAGSWMRLLLFQLDLDLPLTVTKEQVAFFKPRDASAFVPGRFPLFIHRFVGTTSLGSGFPIFGHAGVKLMLDRIGPVIQPDDADSVIVEPSLERLRAYVGDILPTLGDDIVEAVSCRYTMTPDEDFIIDRHPAYPQIVIASPCSGHGFKFGSVIGRVLADLAQRGATDYDIKRFRIDRPALKHQWARAACLSRSE